jgi:serine phosphatase RsbU (regulator of sigma subunit)
VKRRIPSFRPLSIPQKNHSDGFDNPGLEIPDGGSQDSIDECLRAFSNATNWGVDLYPAKTTGQQPYFARLVDNLITPGPQADPDLQDSDAHWDQLPSVSMHRAEALLDQIGKLVQRIDKTETALRDREAELSTIVAFSNHSAPSKELAARLESVLESTARSLGAVAAALYLLDEDTTSLKLRASYALPKSRFLAPARDLPSSLADLEALTGNAVLLSDIQAAREWHSPEPYRSALVVPIAAGRLMGEIEQSILGAEVTMARQIAKHIDAAADFQNSLMADRQILHEDFDLGGWSHQQHLIGGAFHHWNLNQQGKLSIAVGAANSNHATGSMVATSALTLLEAFERIHPLGPETQSARLSHPLRAAIQAINVQHCNRNQDTWQLNMTALEIHPASGSAVACSAGQMHCVILGDRGIRHVGSVIPRLGSNPDDPCRLGRFTIESGDMLVAFTSRLLGESSLDPRNPSTSLQRFDAARMLKFLRDWREEPAQDLACSIAEQLPALDELETAPSDRALIIVKNLR